MARPRPRSRPRPRPSKRSLAAKRGWERRKREERERSLAAKRGWETRRKKELALEKKRSRAAAQGWETRKKNERAHARKAKLTERDLLVLDVWDGLSENQKLAYYSKLSPGGKEKLPSLERRTIESLRVEKRREKRKKGRIAERLRKDLVETLEKKSAKKAIAAEPAGKRIRRIIAQKKGDAEKISKRLAPVPKKKHRGRRGTQRYYYATITAVAEHPPLSGYEPKKIAGTGDRTLSIFHFQAKTATSETELQRNIQDAVENMIAQMPGDAPYAIVGVHVRTVDKIITT